MLQSSSTISIFVRIPSFTALSRARPKFRHVPLLLRTIKSTSELGCFNATSLIVRRMSFAGGEVNTSPVLKGFLSVCS